MIFVLMVLIYRGLILEEGDGHTKLLARKARRAAKLGKQGKGMGSVMWFYGEIIIVHLLCQYGYQLHRLNKTNLFSY